MTRLAIAIAVFAVAVLFIWVLLARPTPEEIQKGEELKQTK